MNIINNVILLSIINIIKFSHTLIILSLHIDSFSSLPVDSEAISNNDKSTERVKKNFDSCKFNNQLIDTFTVDHLLSKLNKDRVAVFSCLSPIDGIGLLYFKKFLNEYILQNKNFLCIPLCDGVHFLGYIVNTKNRKIIHVDSLRWNSASNPTSKLIANTLFPGSQ